MFDVLSVLEERRNTGVVLYEARLSRGGTSCSSMVFISMLPLLFWSGGVAVSSVQLGIYAIVTLFAFRFSYVPISFTIAWL